MIRNNQDLVEQLKDMLSFSIIDIIDLDKYINSVENFSKEEILIKIEGEYIRKIKNIKKGRKALENLNFLGKK